MDEIESEIQQIVSQMGITPEQLSSLRAQAQQEASSYFHPPMQYPQEVTIDYLSQPGVPQEERNRLQEVLATQRAPADTEARNRVMTDMAATGAGLLAGGPVFSALTKVSKVPVLANTIGRGLTEAFADTATRETSEAFGGPSNDMASSFATTAGMSSALPLAGELAGKTAMGGVKGWNWLRGLRTTKSETAYDSAFAPGAIAAQGHNVPRATAVSAQAKLDPILDYEEAWLARNPVAGIDVNSLSTNRGDAAYQSYIGKLSQLRASGVSKKTTALAKAAEIQEGLPSYQGAAPNAPQYPQAAEDELLESIAPLIQEQETITKLKLPGDSRKKEIVDEIQRLISLRRSDFYNPIPDQETGQIVWTSKPNPPSAQELSNVLSSIDDELGSLGAYSDEAILAAFKNNPEAYNTYVSALRKYRAGYKDSISGFLKQLDDRGLSQGESLEKMYLDGLDDYAVGVRYGKAAENFAKESLQGQTPGSASSLIIGQKQPIESANITGAARALVGSSRADQIKANNLFRGSDAVKAMQDIVAYRSNQMAAPISRNLAVFRGSPQQRAKLAEQLYYMGVIMQPLEFEFMPKPQQEQLYHMALQANPSLFEPPQSGFQSEVDGIITSPMERDYATRQAYKAFNKNKDSKALDSLAKLVSEGAFSSDVSAQAEQPAPHPIIELSPDMGGVFQSTSDLAERATQVEQENATWTQQLLGM